MSSFLAAVTGGLGFRVMFCVLPQLLLCTYRIYRCTSILARSYHMCQLIFVIYARAYQLNKIGVRARRTSKACLQPNRLGRFGVQEPVSTNNFWCTPPPCVGRITGKRLVNDADADTTAPSRVFTKNGINAAWGKGADPGNHPRNHGTE